MASMGLMGARKVAGFDQRGTVAGSGYYVLPQPCNASLGTSH